MRLIPRRRERDPERTMTVVEHLEELRRRLIVALAAVGVASVGGWFLFGPAMELLRRPYCDAVRDQLADGGEDCVLRFIGVVDAFVLKLKVVIFLGLALAIPVVLYQLWAFIVPGLTRRERRMAVPFVLSSVLLFALGVVMAYVTLPRGLAFLLDFAGEGIQPLLTADRYVGFVLTLALAFGVAFEFPVLLVFLSMVGVVSSAQMRSWRRYVVLIAAIVAAAITPSGDPYTMLALTVPLVLLYEGAILVSRLLKH